MPRIVVVPNGRQRTAMVFLTWEELQTLSPGQTIKCTGGELVVHTSSIADQYWQFVEDLNATAYRVVICSDSIERLKKHNEIERPGGPPGWKPVEETHIESIGWHPADLCKCGEPKGAEQKGCGHCLSPYDKPIDLPPQSFADLVTYRVLGKPEKPVEAEVIW